MNVRSSFDPTVWVAANLDLLHPPDCISASPRLRLLGIAEMKVVYQLLVRAYGIADWSEFVWDEFAQLVERELRLTA